MFAKAGRVTRQAWADIAWREVTTAMHTPGDIAAKVGACLRATREVPAGVDADLDNVRSYASAAALGTMTPADAYRRICNVVWGLGTRPSN